MQADRSSQYEFIQGHITLKHKLKRASTGDASLLLQTALKEMIDSLSLLQ